MEDRAEYLVNGVNVAWESEAVALARIEKIIEHVKSGEDLPNSDAAELIGYAEALRRRLRLSERSAQTLYRM